MIKLSLCLISIIKIFLNIMLLTNGSKYKIRDVEHQVSKNVIFKNPIKMENESILNDVYDGLKYTINFFEMNEINYIAISGTLIGCIRHEGIIPWDNDFDLLIFREDYEKLRTLIYKFNTDKFKLLQLSPGFRVFVNNNFIGDIFIYDKNNENKMVKAYPYVFGKPSFLINKIYFPWIKYDIDDLLPTKKMTFEDFKINVPNNIKNVLKVNYPKSKLKQCINFDQSLHNKFNYNNFRFFGILEYYSLKIPIIGYILCYIVHKIINSFVKHMWVQF